MFKSTLRFLVVVHLAMAAIIVLSFAAQMGARAAVSTYCATGYWVGVGLPPLCD